MINKGQIQGLIDGFFEESNYFLVDLSISPGNKILIEIDGDNGVDIKKCVELSRHIESHFDRDEIDFSIDVGSPGLSNPFKVKRQYVKRIGKQILVKCLDGQAFEGKLLEVSEEDLGLELEKKKLEKEFLRINFKDIKEAKSVISFK